MAVDEELRGTQPAFPTGVPSPIWRPWRFAAGAAFGAACATKWSGVMALAAGGLLALVWEISRRRQAGEARPVWSTIRMELLGGVLAFAIVPIAVYLLSYTRYFVEQSWHPSTFLEMQRAAFRFHTGLHYITDAGAKAHPYESKPWTWLAMYRPVSYYYASPGGKGTAAEVLSMGHPLLFWGSFLILPAVAWSWFRRRDWRAGLIVVPALVQYVPYFAAASRVQFIFYMTAVTPFLVLAAVYVLRDVSTLGRREGALLPSGPTYVGTYLFAYVALFAFFYPVLTGMHISYDAWHMRMWMQTWI
jgi:dolichyl-phosphate-mannose--protein O-mannosyl transferase